MTGSAYRIADRTLASTIPLPELPASCAAPDWMFDVTPSRLFRGSPPWFQSWRAGGRRWASFARIGRGYLVRFHGFADFVIDDGARQIVCSARAAVHASTVRHLLLDQVLPLAFSRERRLVLHAAGLATPRGTFAFVGPTGAGKSTLAAAIATTGLALMTDDCLVVERAGDALIAKPFYPGARLWRDSLAAMASRVRSTSVAHYTRKRRVGDSLIPYEPDPQPLGGIFVLRSPRHDRRAAVAAVRLSPRRAMLALVGSTFMLDTGDSTDARVAFETQTELVGRLPVYELTYPWRLSRLRETADEVKALMLAN